MENAKTVSVLVSSSCSPLLRQQVRFMEVEVEE